MDNELICNVNYIKHPPRQHLCVSVFNLKRLSLKMSFSIKSLDSIYISCIRVNLCLTQSINHCQGVLCLYLSSSPTPSPHPPILAHATFKKASSDAAYKQLPVLRPSAGRWRRDPSPERCAARASGGREVLLSFSWLPGKDLPRKGALSLAGSFPTHDCLTAKGAHGLRVLEAEVFYWCTSMWSCKIHGVRIIYTTRGFGPVFLSPVL